MKNLSNLNIGKTDEELIEVLYQEILEKDISVYDSIPEEDIL